MTNGADNGQSSMEKTQETDVLMSILHELRKIQESQIERDKKLDKRISDIERELGLVRVELERQGETMATMEHHCRNRLKICTASERSSSGDSWPACEKE